MKTLITASALILSSSVAFGASFEEQFQSPDLGTGVYDKPVTLSEPMISDREVSVSLDSFNKGNPEHSSHATQDIISGQSDEGFASSLDIMNQGNPDHV